MTRLKAIKTIPISRTGCHHGGGKKIEEAEEMCITPSQYDLLIFMEAFLSANDNMPTYRDIMDEFGYKSTNSVKTKIDSLMRKGWLEQVGQRQCVRFSRTNLNID